MKEASQLSHRIERGTPRGLLLGLLLPLSLLYRAGVGARSFLYRLGLLKQRRLSAEVISVGNLTVGGTGKTPLVIYLAERLSRQNKKVAILTRGYKRKKKDMIELTQATRESVNWQDTGDEPYLLAGRLSQVSILVTKNRVLSGGCAIERLGSEILILDDGFQHLRLFRNLDVVVIDSSNPFGNGRLLPAGILREPISSLKRADVFVLTKADQAKDKGGLIEKLRTYNPKAPVVESVYCVRSIEDIFDHSSVNVEVLKNRKTLAFSGIGNPVSFTNTLEQLGIKILGHRVFRDHYAYRKNDVVDLAEEARDLGADFIVTTEKDSVRIPLINQLEIPFYVLKIDIKIISGEETLIKRVKGRE
jgi:tetraacyldisaccharide 4'-kinase